jgi:hypothetical protein
LRWYLKAIVQKAIGIVPFGTQLNYFFQKNITKRVILNDWFFDDILTHYIRFKKLLNENTSISSFDNIAFLELGTGWHPIMPLLFSLENAKEVCSADLNFHVRKENLLRLISFFENRIQQQFFSKNNININENKWQLLMKIKSELQKSSSPSLIKLNNLFSEMNITFYNGDAAKLSFDNKSFDVCFSINTLEHIYQPMLQNILQNYAHHTNQNGYHLHVIDMNDHFSHIDSSITKYNYLQFSNEQWKLIDNNLQPQNRLRITDFENIFLKIDLKIIKEVSMPAEMESFNSIILHQDFKKYNAERCAIPNTTMLLQKA